MSADRIFKWNDLEVEIDLSDYAQAETWESALDKMQQKEQEIARLKKTSEILKARADSARELFDDMFGEGSSAKAFGDSTSVVDITKGVSALIEFTGAQAGSIAQDWEKTFRKYSPKRVVQKAARKQ